MHRIPFLAAAILVFAACGGDPRADYAGTYDFYGNMHLTLVAPDSPHGNFHTGARIEFIADALDSDRLFVDYNCGIDAHLEGDGTFSIPAKLCPEVTSGSCRYRTIHDHGTVKRYPSDGSLQFTLTGAFTKICADGSSVRENFSLMLEGKKADLSKPPPDSGLTPVGTPQALPSQPRTAG